MSSSTTTWLQMRHRWSVALHTPSQSHGWGRRFNVLLSLLILANVAAVVIDTQPTLSGEMRSWLDIFEKVSFSLFAIEYLARVWACVEVARYAKPIAGRVRYAMSVLPLVDLAVLLSFFAPFDLRFLRLMRIVRLLRVLHLQEYEKPVKAIGTGPSLLAHSFW